MPDVVVLVSGGLDSMVLVEMARQCGRFAGGIHFVYPHPAQSHERRAVIALRRRLHLEADPAPVLDVPIPLRASQLDIGVGESGPRVVPVRNLSMLAIGANLAASFHASEVWIGATSEDSADYPDCRKDYLEAVSLVCAPFGVTVRAPLLGCERGEVERLADSFGIDRSSVWSCYQPRNGKPCGVCNSCRQGSA